MDLRGPLRNREAASQLRMTGKMWQLRGDKREDERGGIIPPPTNSGICHWATSACRTPPPISHVLGGVEVNKQALDGFTSFTADYNQGLLGLSLSVRSVPVMLTQWRNYRAGQRGS